MKFLLICCIVAVAVAARPKSKAVPFLDAKGHGPKIISGQPASRGQFPWQIVNRFRVSGGTAFCGGALITNRWVLTAGHCAPQPTIHTIILGTLYSAGGGEGSQVRESTKNIPHPSYDPYWLTNDLALVDLIKPVVFSDTIQPIKLGTSDIGADVRLTVSGWGKTSDSSFTVSDVLNYVELDTISNFECAGVYGLTVTDGTLCCRGRPEHSTCNGDSGSPLVQLGGEAAHVGVVSFVHVAGCASGNPSGYTRTSYYLDWINSNAV